MKKYLPILSFLMSANLSIAQNTGCIDSISFNRYYPSYFKINHYVSSEYNNKPQRDRADNIYLGGVTSISSLIYSGIIKFNNNNQLLWYKNYKYDIFSTALKFGDLVSIDDKADLLFFGSLRNLANNTSWPQIIKIDSAGTFKWGKVLKRIDDPNIQIFASKPYANNNSSEIFCTAIFDNDNTKMCVIAMDGQGNIKWANQYDFNSLPKFHYINQPIVSQNGNVVTLCIQFYYNSDDATAPTAIHGLHMLQLNKADGSILKQNTFGYFDDNSFTIRNVGTLNTINYNPSSGLFLLDSYGQRYGGFTGLSHIYTIVDSNLNPLKTVWYKSLLNASGGNVVGNGERSNIDEKNTITLGYTFTNPLSGPETFSYTSINEQLELITQKKINLTNLGFPNDGFVSDVAYRKNGILNFQLVTTRDIGVNSIYLYDNSPFYNGTSLCQGIDTPIYAKAPLHFKALSNVAIQETGIVPIQAVSVTIEPPVDFVLPKEELCKALSICDTIKLFGTQFHCLSSPLDSFKIYRNPLCVRKTNWQVDTNYIKILSQNDTVLYVQYLRPYRGSIKVAFGGCSLTDEIPIEVYAPKTSLSLGPDTVNCPGKSTVLRAGSGFRTYLWSDGSSADTLSVNLPGTYWVMATDSCGTVFRDSVVVNPFDVTLNLNYPQQLCRRDTAFFTLPDKLYNYTWQPATGASLSNYTWRLFPSVTTTYTITGERLPGCFLTDTVLVNVKNCPSYMLFPNAFTPNNDGLNDLYKPSVVGTLQSYELIIYNRYGQTVFRSKDPNEGWNGGFKNNSKPSAGSYVWFCRYRFIGGQTLQDKGTFLLIR